MAFRLGVVFLCLAWAGLSGCVAPPALLNEELTVGAFTSSASPAAQHGSVQDFASLGQPGVMPATPLPATVNVLDQKTRYLSLAEAFALALERGYTGFESITAPGFANEALVAFNGATVSGADSVRVLALEPALTGANVDLSLSRFDAQLFSNASFAGIDNPPQGIGSTRNGSASNAAFGLAKPLAGGGVTGISWITDYFWTNSAPSNFTPFFNPTYFTRLQFGVEQPLLRERGVAINQLLDRFPASSLFPSLNGRFGAGQGILIARMRHDQQKAEFERRINHLLLNVETAYWNLYAAYIDLYSTEQALRMAAEVWRIAKEQYPEKIDEGDFAGTRAQLQSFRGNRLQAIGRVLETERNLRLLVGLPVADGCRLLPVDTPTTTAYTPDWNAALHDALERRPELALARQELERRRLNLLNQVNKLQPDLRFLATTTLLGVGSRLDGSGAVVDPASGGIQPNNALRSMTSGDFNDWTVGLQFSTPLGFRAEHAVVRQARLELVQSQIVLSEQEIKVRSYLAKQYSRLFELVEVLETRRLERRALADQLEVRLKKFTAGKIPIDFLQNSVRNWAAALSAEYRAMVDYNNALAAFHFAKGTLLDYSQVHLLEGPAPAIRPVRAVEHEQQRAQELARRMASRPVADPETSEVLETSKVSAAGLRFPEIPAREAVALPSLWAETPNEPMSIRPVSLLQPTGAGVAQPNAPFIPPAPGHSALIGAPRLLAPAPASSNALPPRAVLGSPKGT